MTSAACSRTVKTRCSEIQTARSIVSGGEPSALMEKEVLTPSDDMQKAGIALQLTQLKYWSAWLSLEQNEIMHYTNLSKKYCSGGSKHQEVL